MTNLPLTILSQNPLKVTLGWTPPANVAGYRFFRDGQPVSSSWDATKSQVTFGLPDDKPHTFTVLAVTGLAQGSVTVNGPTPPPPPPSSSYGARSLPQGPFTERTGALWFRSNSSGTISKQHVHDTPDYGVAAMGYFSPAPPPPSTGTLTVTDVIGERVGRTPPSSNGTAEAGLWFGQQVNVTRALGHGTWMGAWTGAQCRDSTIIDLTCAVLNADGTLGKLPAIGLYIEHATRRTVFDGITIRCHGTGINAEWWYPDSYAKYVAAELPGAPAGKGGSWDCTIKNFDIQSDTKAIFLDAGTCGFHISHGVTNAPIYLPRNLAVSSKPNVVDESTITYTGTGDLVRYHSNAIG